MELFIGIIVIFVLLLCMGASISFIATLALSIIGILIILMTIFFIYATVLILSGKRVKGRYVRSEHSPKGKILHAVYVVDETEYKNLFPLEVMFRDKIYHTEKEVNLILNYKKKCCFDTNAKICCVLGIIVSLFLLFEMIILITGNILL